MFTLVEKVFFIKDFETRGEMHLLRKNDGGVTLLVLF